MTAVIGWCSRFTVPLAIVHAIPPSPACMLGEMNAVNNR
jgi:hypothetical protein